MSVPLSWESLPLRGGLSSRSQSAPPCSTSPQNTLSQPLPTVTHKKPPRENKGPSQFFHQSWKNSSKSILFSHWTKSLASFPTTIFFTRRRSLTFRFWGAHSSIHRTLPTKLRMNFASWHSRPANYPNRHDFISHYCLIWVLSSTKLNCFQILLQLFILLLDYKIPESRDLVFLLLVSPLRSPGYSM